MVSSPTGATVNSGSTRNTGTLLHGRWLAFIRAGTAGVALLSLGTFVVRLPAFLLHVQTACTDPNCAYGQLTFSAVETLKGVKLSLGDYAAFQITLTLLWAVVCLAVGTLIVWRKSTDWMALLVAALLVLWPTAMVIGTFSLGSYSTIQGSSFLDALLSLLARFGFFLVFFLFPNGRLASRWTLLLPGSFFLDELSYHFFSTWPFPSPGGFERLFSELIYIVTMLSLVAIIWYRYRHLASAVERQQIKWAAFGAIIITVGFGLRLVPQLLVPALDQPNSLYDTLSTAILIGVSLIFPFSIGLAILRYRLWDVDILINKALVYSGLSGTLAAIYAGFVLGLESLAALFIGQRSQPVVIVISTLAIAALFQPLRQRVQQLVDHRFYRSKYDATRIMADFHATLRQKVDLDQLRTELLAVVQETMQPAHLSLWLFPHMRQEKTGKSEEKLPRV